jgi:hypothetical protein
MRKAGRTAANSVERYDPEGPKNPEGERRLEAQPLELAGRSATGLKQGSGHFRGKPGVVAERKGRTGTESGERDSEVAGQDL